MTFTKLNIEIPDDYKPSDGELDNLVYLALKYGANWQMRGCDKQVVLVMCENTIGSVGISKVLETACEYAWDHILGEPDEGTPEDMYNHLKPLIEEWYSKSTVEERANTQ